MSEMLMWEIQYLMVSITTGVFLGVVYDFLRIFRKIVRHSLIWVSIEDIIFWMFVGIFTFAICFIEDAGNVRGFAIVAEIVGAFMYHFSVSDFLVKILAGILNFPGNILKKALKKPDESYKIKKTSGK